MDKHTAKRYDPMEPLPSYRNRNQPLPYYDELLNEDVILEIVSARRMAATSQLKHSRLFVDLLTDPEHPFEDLWTSLSEAEKEKHFFEGFKTNEESKSYAQFTQGKADCPELNRDALAADGFVELMRQCVLSDNNVVPIQPTEIVNARFDKIIGYIPNDPSHSRAAVHAMARMSRTGYISACLSLLLLAFFTHI